MPTSTEAMEQEENSDVDSKGIMNAHSANITGISGRNMFENPISSPISNQIKLEISLKMINTPKTAP